LKYRTIYTCLFFTRVCMFCFGHNLVHHDVISVWTTNGDQSNQDLHPKSRGFKTPVQAKTRTYTIPGMKCDQWGPVYPGPSPQAPRLQDTGPSQDWNLHHHWYEVWPIGTSIARTFTQSPAASRRRPQPRLAPIPTLVWSVTNRDQSSQDRHPNPAASRQQPRPRLAPTPTLVWRVAVLWITV